jgi:hypothetical protein
MITGNIKITVIMYPTEPPTAKTLSEGTITMGNINCSVIIYLTKLLN